MDMAVQNNFPDGVRNMGLNLMSDNGCQPTDRGFRRACVDMGITQAFTSYNNPKGNADTERMFRTAKEELLWLQEWENLGQLKSALSQWIDEYNTSYLHSSLGYRTPSEVHEEHHINRKKIPLIAA